MLCAFSYSPRLRRFRVGGWRGYPGLSLSRTGALRGQPVWTLRITEVCACRYLRTTDAGSSNAFCAHKAFERMQPNSAPSPWASWGAIETSHVGDVGIFPTPHATESVGAGRGIQDQMLNKSLGLTRPGGALDPAVEAEGVALREFDSTTRPRGTGAYVRLVSREAP